MWMQQTLWCQVFANKAKSLVSGYIPGDFLNMPMYWHSWNTTHRTRHVWRQENMPTSLVVNIMVSGIQTWPRHASGAPANCASGALRSWFKTLTPRIVRIHWNFRFFCNMTRLLSIFVQGTRKGNQVGSLPKCRRWLAQPSVYIPNRVGSLWRFFHLTLWPCAELHTIVLQIQWWFVHQCTRQRLLGLDIHWKQPANAKLEALPLLAGSQLPHCDNWRWTRRASVQSCKVALKQSWILMWILLTEFVAKEALELINLLISAIDWSDYRLYREPSTTAKMQGLVRWKTSANGTCARCAHVLMMFQ